MNAENRKAAKRRCRRVAYWFEQTHGLRFYLGLLVLEVGLRPRRYRWRWEVRRVDS